jgi:hypothetical protein
MHVKKRNWQLSPKQGRKCVKLSGRCKCALCQIKIKGTGAKFKFQEQYLLSKVERKNGCFGLSVKPKLYYEVDPRAQFYQHLWT